jgi:hypothetical protein
MSVNSKPTASQQNKKKLLVSTFFPFVAGIVDTGDQLLLSNISTNFFNNSKWPRWDTQGTKLIYDKSLKSKISYHYSL